MNTFYFEESEHKTEKQLDEIQKYIEEKTKHKVVKRKQVKLETLFHTGTKFLLDNMWYVDIINYKNKEYIFNDLKRLKEIK